MTMPHLAGAPAQLLTAPTTTQLRPRYEGSNITTWIGFKHVNYLVEEAVLEHFRACGLAARTLYERHGLGVELVDLDTRILHALHMDDLATAEIVPEARPEGDLAFSVTLHVPREQGAVKAVTSRVRVLLRQDDGVSAEPPPDAVTAYVVPRIERGNDAPLRTSIAAAAPPLAVGRGTAAGGPLLDELTRDGNAFAWRWRMPYFYCHFTERVQMSGYLRLMEEVVDLFLADRGISIRTLLDRDWIPVVPHSCVTVLDEALMEEEVYTVFTVTDVFKGVTYTAAMDCYALRDRALVKTATGTITHGYAEIGGRGQWSLVEFDEPVLRALQGDR